MTPLERLKIWRKNNPEKYKAIKNRYNLKKRRNRPPKIRAQKADRREYVKNYQSQYYLKNKLEISIKRKLKRDTLKTLEQEYKP